MRGATLVIEALKKHKIKKIFGYPGGAIMPVYDAIYDAVQEGSIDHTLCRNEQGAAFAAQGYARSTASVGVCFATSGPGATNLVTGLADALTDSVPIVAITGQVGADLIGTDAFQEGDILGLSLSCTKHSYLVTDPMDLPRVLMEAFVVAQSGRPGPVWVDIAKNVQLVDMEFPSFPEIKMPSIPSVDIPSILNAKRLLEQAQRPVVYLGGGVKLGKATQEFRQFIEEYQLPTVSTLTALGTVEKNTPYYLGMVGMHGNQAANLVVQQSDLLLVVGARFDDRVTGKLDTFAPDAKIIHIDIDAAEIGKLRNVDVALKGEIKEILSRLSGIQLSNLNAWRSLVDNEKQKYAWTYQEEGTYISGPTLLKHLSDKLSDTAVVATDVGQHQMWAAQHMLPTQPENFLTSAAFGTMGFGLPSAIGAKIARPEDQVVLVSGDGSFMMNIQELGTIKRKKVPLKIVLLNNQRLGMVRQWQNLFFQDHLSETVLDDNPDFVALAAAFGIQGKTITQPEEVEDALDEMLNAQGAYLLHVRIFENENVWPLVPPGAANQNMLEEDQ